jgi:hypothetical protein
VVIPPVLARLPGCKIFENQGPGWSPLSLLDLGLRICNPLRDKEAGPENPNQSLKALEFIPREKMPDPVRAK